MPLYQGEPPVVGHNSTGVGVSESDPGVERIVLIDDLYDGRRMLAETLRDEGYTVFEAENGEAGLELVERHHPQAVLTDIGLPDISGYEVAKQLRSRWSPERLLLVAVTGYGQDNDRMQAMDAGFDLHLVKPVDLARLLKSLSSWKVRPANDSEMVELV